MKIVQVVHCYPPEPVGGTERVVASLVRGLKARGHDLHVIAGSLDWQAGFRVERDTYEEVPVTRIHRDDPWFDQWDNGYHPGVEQLYKDLLRELNPDVVHIHHWIRLTRNLAQLTRAEGIPALVQLHDFHSTCPRTFRLTPERTFCNRTASIENCLSCVKRWSFQGDAEVAAHLDHFTRDMINELRSVHAVLALSEAQAQLVGSVLPVKTGPTHLLPPGSPVELCRRNHHGTSETLRVIHWGNLYDLKGVLLLIEAVAMATEKVSIELEVMGRATQPEFKAELEARSNGLPVRFRGEYDRCDLESVQADIAVFPSLCYETYSLVVDEAFMLGLPVIVSDLGAPPDRIGSGGLAVPAGDVKALADELVRLALDRTALERLRAGVVRNGQTTGDMAARAEMFYQSTIQGKEDIHPLDNPVSDRERLMLSWFTAGQRLLSLAGSGVRTPPLTGLHKEMLDYLRAKRYIPDPPPREPVQE